MVDRRREKGSGSVFQRSDGRWIGVLDYGLKPNGQRNRRTVSAKTEREVRRKLRDLATAKVEDAKATGDRRTTVATYSAKWLKRTRQQIRPDTWIGEAGAVRKWVLPTIGHRRLTDLTPDDIRRVADAVIDGGLTASTAHRYQGIVMRMLKAAALDGHAVPNRVFLTEKPSAGENDRQAIPTPEAMRVLREAGQLPHGAMYLIAMLQGMRRAEICGMTWDTVDLDAGVLRIDWQLKSLRYREKRNPASGFVLPRGFVAKRLVDSWHLVRPKTKHSQRVIPLIPIVVTALRAWREVAPDNPWGLVWATEKGRPFPPETFFHEWQALQAAAEIAHPSGRPYFLHEIRHTTATLLAELGVPESVRIAIMGHSSIAVTRGYETATVDAAKAALEKVAGRLELPGG